ncbi:MAG: hypothetical protein IPL26_02760 [Leptospiraceae bacterium]|nr:hypothetical protein [Leptospiraceae bacterium]
MKINCNKLIVLGTFIFPILLFSDSIVLKSGKKLQGNVINQENNIVTLLTSTGDKIQIKKSEIVSMIYAESKPKKKVFTKQRIKPQITATKQSDLQNEDPLEVNLFSNSESAELSRDKVQINNNEKIVEKTETVTVDKELTNSVMQKFEDADKRRLESTNSELQILREELDYLKKEKERSQKMNNQEDEFRKTLDKRMAGLEIRIRRLEKYLGMDESMVDYYQRKRSPWDLVWRSTLFPGWGHRYAKEEYTGNAYSTSIIVLFGLSYFINYQANALADTAKIALYNDTIIKTYQFSNFGSNSSYSSVFVLNGYATYQTTMVAVNSQKELANNFISLAMVLYVAQIVHSYFTGVEWAKVQPRNYSNEELLKPTGFNIKSKSDSNNLARVPERGILYEFEFTQRY